VSVHGPPRLYFERLKLLNFDFHSDPDPAFHSNANPYLVSCRYGSGSISRRAKMTHKHRKKGKFQILKFLMFSF
jgi:hypothetical protein